MGSIPNTVVPAGVFVFSMHNGLVDTARAVKSHLRATFGLRSDAYQAALPILFTKT